MSFSPPLFQPALFTPGKVLYTDIVHPHLNHSSFVVSAQKYLLPFQSHKDVSWGKCRIVLIFYVNCTFQWNWKGKNQTNKITGTSDVMILAEIVKLIRLVDLVDPVNLVVCGDWITLSCIVYIGCVWKLWFRDVRDSILLEGMNHFCLISSWVIELGGCWARFSQQQVLPAGSSRHPDSTEQTRDLLKICFPVNFIVFWGFLARQNKCQQEKSCCIAVISKKRSKHQLKVSCLDLLETFYNLIFFGLIAFTQPNTTVSLQSL